MSSAALGTGLSCGFGEKVWGREGCEGLQGIALSAGWRSQASLGAFLGFFTALYRVCPRTGADVYSRYLPGFAHTRSCVNLQVKGLVFFFSPYISWRETPLPCMD